MSRTVAPPPPRLRLTRRGRLVLFGLAVATLVLIVTLIVLLVRSLAAPAEPVVPVATVDPTCVPTDDT